MNDADDLFGRGQVQGQEADRSRAKADGMNRLAADGMNTRGYIADGSIRPTKRPAPAAALSPSGPASIAEGCDQGTDKNREGDAQ